MRESLLLVFLALMKWECPTLILVKEGEGNQGPVFLHGFSSKDTFTHWAVPDPKALQRLVIELPEATHILGTPRTSTRSPS
jgi:hypothetical protein